ncbi:hypothetical protein C5E45_04705 [Nocardia nova]|uniref:PPE domain-containing protein n=1 Tax=Nocardia nova TaxID=37330 RepID=A0A2S6AW60_9NOCA|nr:hypothetical protein [Nocardia nova]PPJ33645.1 hypothetical protein C5E41_03630 [Nocardia nova]PPJ39439.1 hypothetical protein C5E45_04705 [Nocardia nova]
MGDDSKPGTTPPIIGIIDAVNTGDPTLDPKLVPKSNAAQFYQRSAADEGKAAGNVDHDPDYIPAAVMEPFRSMSHDAILAGVTQMKPGLMHQFAQGWKKTADATLFNNMALNAKVHKSVAAGWEGRAADAVIAATQRFTNEMAEMHNVAQSVMSRIEAAAYGADVVKAQVPPLPPPKPIPTVDGAESPKDAVGAVTTGSSEEQAAQWAMVNHYVPTYQPAGQQVPMFTPPTAPDDGGGVNPPGVGGRLPGGDTGGTVDGHQKPGGDNRSGTGDGTGAGDQQPGTDPAAAASNQTSPAGSTRDASSTTPAGLDSTATTPAGLGGTSGSGTGSGLGGVPGYAGGPGRTGGPSSPGGPGRSVPGVPGAGDPLGKLGALGRPAAAAAGAAGLPGMGMPGAKGKGEEDKERKGNPDLLVHERNKADLIGDPPPAVPPVFGAYADDPPQRRKQTESDW